MAYDGSTWSGMDEAAALERRIAAARAEVAAAERAWRETFDPEEDVYGPRPPDSSHPLRASTRERFRAAHAALIELQDELAETEAAGEDLLAA